MKFTVGRGADLWNGNIYLALSLRLLVALFLFSCCRVGFYFFNLDHFQGLSLGYFFQLMGGGLVFDLTAVLYLNLLFILLMIVPFDFRFKKGYQRLLYFLYLTTNGLGIAANVSDFIYFKFTLRRTTFDVFSQFEHENNMLALWLRFLMDYWYAVLFWGLLMIVMSILYSRIKVRGPLVTHKGLYYTGGTAMMLLSIYLVIGGIRGGFRHSTRPITLGNAGEYVKDPKDVSIVLNTPFAILRTIGKTHIQRMGFFSAQELATVFNPVHTPSDTLPFVPANVVVIILESFSNEFIGANNKDKENGTYKGYTPFLDSLIQHSLSFDYGIANGRKSIDGLPAVVSSLPSLGVPYVLSPYASNQVNSLASLLKEEGYHTSFFHGAPNGSMGFNAFMNLAKVDHYYGMTEYGNEDDFDGLWGIWDDKFLSYFATKMNSFPQPFLSVFFSVSSHHPFEIPEPYRNVFQGGPLPIHKCIQYTDNALKLFFESVSQEPWYKNTLFVITADHTSSNIQFPESMTPVGYYRVPLIFFRPDNSLSNKKTEIAQQIDIMPSVLGYLHFKKPFVAFGRNVFDPNQKGFAFNYNQAYQFFQDDYLLLFDGQKSTSLFNIKSDPLIQNNLIGQHRKIAKSMERQMKAIIQQYNNRIMENRLTVEHHKH